MTPQACGTPREHLSTAFPVVHRWSGRGLEPRVAQHGCRMTDALGPLDDLILRRDALMTGLSDGELARLIRAGELGRLRRGAYVDSVLPATGARRHRLLIRATVAGLRRPAVVSHQSAAVLHGL